MAPRNNTENALLRVAGLVRVSHLEQKLHGYSVEHQVKSIKKYAKENGMTISKWYIDEAKSASKDQRKRTAFQELMSDVQEGEIDYILFTRLDRYFRDVRSFYRCEDIYEKHNVRWKCTEESFDNYTPKGKELLHFKIVLAQMESDRIGERIDFTFRNMVSEKRPISGSQPFGYKIKGEGRNKSIVKDKENEQIINDIFDHYELYRSKNATTKYIAETHRPVSYKIITKVLKNEQYTGTYRGVEDYCPAYITKERFDRIQEILQSNVKKTKEKRVFIFSGTIKCGHCGCRFVGNTSKGGGGTTYKIYRCGRFNNYGTCDNRKGFNELKIERYLLENIVEEVRKYEVKAKVEEAKAKKPKANKAAIEKKIERVQQMYEDGAMSYDRFKERYNDLTAKIKEIEAEEKQFDKRDLAPIKKLFEAGFEEAYSTLSDTEKTAFWGKIIKELKVYSDGKIDVFF